MGTEIFLILLTLCTAFIKKSETAPALLYTGIAFFFYFVSLLVVNPFYLLVMAMILEVVTVFLLVCLKGCLKSTVVACLIPLSIGALAAHFIGWCLLYNGMELALYNNLIDVYWATILGLFLSMSRWMNGSFIKFIRLFRRHDNQPRII